MNEEKEKKGKKKKGKKERRRKKGNKDGRQGQTNRRHLENECCVANRNAMLAAIFAKPVVRQEFRSAPSAFERTNCLRRAFHCDSLHNIDFVFGWVWIGASWLVWHYPAACRTTASVCSQTVSAHKPVLC